MPKDLKIVTYFTSWGVYGRKYYPWDVPADKLTHINYAFANLTPSGELAWHDTWSDLDKRYVDKGDSWNDPPGFVYGNIKHLFELKKKHRHLKILLSIGGWTLSKHFPSVMSDATKRSKCVDSSIEFMLQHGFDGLDYDWEWLNAVGNSHNEPPREDDGNNFALFLAELRQKMNLITPKRNFLVTIAGPAAVNKIDASKVELWQQHLDFVNIMAYDYEGSWSQTVGHLANLKGASAPGSSFSTEKAVDRYIQKGVDPHRIVIGIPFYSRGFANVQGGWGDKFNGVPPANQSESKWENGNSDYKGINGGNATGSDGTEFTDSDAVAARCVNYNKKTYWSYDNPTTVGLKMDYILSKGLGGAMSWSIDGDLPINHPRSLSKVIHDKFTKQGLDHSQNILHFPTSTYTNLNGLPYEPSVSSGPSVPSTPLVPTPSGPQVPSPSVPLQPSIPSPSVPSTPLVPTPSGPQVPSPSVPLQPSIPSPVVPPWFSQPTPTVQPPETTPIDTNGLLNLKTIHISFDLNIDKSEITNGVLNLKS